jgi:hypothetical protein
MCSSRLGILLAMEDIRCIMNISIVVLSEIFEARDRFTSHGTKI